MSKVRVYEIAKQLGIEEAAAITLLQAQGAPVRNRLSAVEQALAGKPATKDTIANASAAASVADLNSDIHASDEYRRAMLKVFTQRALESALARA